MNVTEFSKFAHEATQRGTSISDYAQISIAISLQRIAEALERQPLMSAGIWDNTRIPNPDMEFSTDKWREQWPPSVTPLTPELARAGMLVPVMDWQQVALNGGPPCFYVETNTPNEHPRYCGRAERWQGHGTIHKYVSLADLLSPASPVGESPSERELILAYLRTFDVGEDWNLARGLVADIEGNKHLLVFPRASPKGDYPPIIVSQPATFESLAPTPLIELPTECWCSAGPSEPVHDPKYGSHVFGEESNCGGVK